MRWRTSSSSANETADRGSGAPFAANVTQPEAEQHHEASTSSTSLSPLAEQDMEGVADVSLSASASMMGSGNSGNTLSYAVSSRQAIAIDPAADSSSTSAADPEGDPPYKRSQQSHRQQATSNGEFESNDEEDMDALPALEAVNPEDGDDDVDDDTGDDQEIPWKPQATQSTCEFTHTITNYSQKRDSGCKKAEYSATTVDEFGNRWRLIVYVNGNGRASNHHLSLFLQVADADDLPFGWKKAVSYVLTLEHPTGPNLSYAKRNPDKTFKLCPKAIDWGWSQFITSDRIQQEGFVQDDSLIVRASVTVKSSSVSIDLEDAELYLKCAVEEGKPEAVQLCLDQGASVNCQFKDDLYTPLHTACSTSTGEDDDEEDEEDDDEDEDEDIGRGHAGNKKSRNSARPTASSGSMRVLQLLLDKGADGNACNKWRETPLLIAANNGHRAAVEALLKHGADPSLCSEAGWSALTFAAHKGYDDIVELLLEAGAPVNCRVTEDASTPLHKACAGSKTGHLIAVKLLLASNADVHALNKWRETPLLTAANHGQAGAVDSLLKAGADPCKCTDTGWSPLSIAAYKGHDDVVRLLLEEGAPTEEADPTLSALLQAATKGLPDTVELLLKHGADHTVTTKKGDTALSILVEQNLIDAAVDMVTEYNASIPRCSRDRKKVQRARLLINLRIKQRQREGKDINLIESDGEDDDEIDKNENPDLLKSTSSAVPDEEDNENLDRYEEIYQIGSSSKKKKKNKKKKVTAEQQAKAAEEALLLELELEDAERQKQESEASKKSAKKRKKKERERQQKKEQEEKRLAEEKEREDKIRTEREEREAKERAERERIMAAKRQEEDEERKRAIERQKFEQQQRDEQRKKELLNRKQQQESLSANSSVSSTEKKSKQSSSKPMKRQSGQVTSRPATSIATVNSSKSTKTKPSGSVISNAALPILSKLTGKNRGWETKPIAPQVPSPAESKSIPSKLMGGSSRTISDAYHRSSNTFPSDIERSQPLEPLASVASSSPFASFSTDTANLPATGPLGFNLSETILNGLSAPPSAGKGVEVPAVALFRRNKVSELLQRCAIGRTSSEALGAISETTMKKVLYRWMVRATHESTNYLDCIIPSWTDFEKLSAFFQRQFISENRKGITSSSLGIPMVSIEALKEAGSNIAILCYNLAKEVADFRGRVEEQLSPDWNDAIIGMEASEMLRNGSDHGASIVLDWAGRAQVLLPSFTFRKLQQRYTGLSGRFLSAVFSTKIRYETQKLITSDTLMDFQLPSHTLSVLSLKASVTAEVWSDPLSTMSGNLFWGQFFDTDEAFGGLAPFSKDESSDEILVRHGGSVVATIPLDNMVASRYMHRIIDILDLAENSRIPLSFAIFLRSECFLDGKVNPSFHDLCVLEPRLRERSELISSVKELAPQQHGYFCMKSDEFEPSETGSLLAILQNLSGKNHYGLSDMVVGEILRSLGTNPELVHSDGRDLSIMSEMSFSAPEFVPASSRNKDLSASVDAGNNMFHHSSDYGQSQGPTSPMAHQSTMLPDFGGPIGDFIGFGGVPIGNAFSMQSHASSRSSRPRGRLFDLVDDGEDETADVVSGMLGNLNMDDLFSQQPNRNSNGEIDIEAISLMGIGGPGPTSSSSSGGGLQPRRGPFGY